MWRREFGIKILALRARIPIPNFLINLLRVGCCESFFRESCLLLRVGSFRESFFLRVCCFFASRVFASRVLRVGVCESGFASRFCCESFLFASRFCCESGFANRFCLRVGFLRVVVCCESGVLRVGVLRVVLFASCFVCEWCFSPLDQRLAKLQFCVNLIVGHIIMTQLQTSTGCDNTPRITTMCF